MNIKEFISKHIFPKHYVCMLCFKEAVVNKINICSDCAEKIKPFGKLLKRENISELTAAVFYDDAVKVGIHKFKYSGARYVADTIAEFMKVPENWNVDYITAVPLTKERYKWRGYNQSIELAKIISEREGIPLKENALIKVRETDNQAKLTSSERRENLRGAFKANESLKGISVLLIDDVITTGSTIAECAKVLKRAGAERVYAMAFAIVESSELN